MRQPPTESSPAPVGPARPTPLDPTALRREFPILEHPVHGRRLAYLDNAATTQKPREVLAALEHHYSTQCSNVHRGVHYLSQKATDAFEAARVTIARFVGAADPREIVFVRGTTEAINLVAGTFGRSRIGEGDEVLITGLEHHSNIVPWQMLVQERRARLVVAPVRDDGSVALADVAERIGPRTRLVAVTHISNALGTVLPIRDIVEAAHGRGVAVLVDGAQAVGHQRVDVRALGCDFYCFSGHKMYGPTGIGVLYGRLDRLEDMPPWQGGGDMIESVSFERSTWNRVPHKFEAGTPDIAGAIGLAAAAGFLRGLDPERVAAHERGILSAATAALEEIPGIRILGQAPEKSGVVSFLLDGVHPHDIGTVLDLEGVAIRAGHHCAQPVMQRFGVPATARASFGVYNGADDIDALVGGLRRVRELFC